jgi:hypothetical protein
MALTRITSGGIAPGVVIKFDSNNTPTSPAFSFNNPSDTGTGIYQSATNELSIATAGQTRLTFKSDGKIITANGSIFGGTNPDFANAKNIMLYVNQSDLNCTDSITNDGGNVNRPFKTIERALLEAARRSYVAGNENDKFEAFTIMVMPGDYTIDNRPGVTGNLNTNLTFSTFENELYKFNPKNGGVIVPRGTSIVGYDLRKTVIRPRFVPNPSSALGADTGDGIGISHIFYDAANMIERNRGYIQEQSQLYIASLPGYTGLTDAKKALCIRDIGYFIDGVIADLRTGGNANSFIVGEFYTNGTTNQYLANANEISATVTAFNYARDLMIKAARNWAGGYAHTPLAGATVTKTTFTGGVDYTVGSGDCSTVDSAVTTLAALVNGIIQNPDTYTTLYTKTPGVFEQTSIFKVTGGCYFWQMTFKDAATAPFNGVTYSSGIPTFATAADANYSHHRVVAFTYADQRTTDGELDQYYKKIDLWDTTIDGGNSRQVKKEEYEIVGDRSKNTTIDTVNSCSPYIFNCSLRSVFGMCGMHTDGSKVAENSFKSMVVAQFTGISLQRDNNAFYQPKDAEGDGNNPTYNDSTGVTNPPIYADPDAEYRPDWRHFHIKASNGGFIQVVSVFAVGYADQFLAETGGDMSITNSNSNFGQISLRAKGSQFKSFAPAANGKITALIPPRGITSTPSNVEFYAIDYTTTWQKNGQTDKNYNANLVSTFVSNQSQFRIYLDIGGLNSESDIPELVVDSYDYSTNSTVTKRYLNFGSNQNYNLFRDYYSTTGTVSAANALIQTTVETETGGVQIYTAKVALSGTTSAETSGNNSQRQGYFWDATENRVYIKINADDAATDIFITNYIFATTQEATFTTTETTNPDGSISIVTGTSNITVLQNFDGFPSTLATSKFIDSRTSTPSDLLWRVEYTIPKGLTTIPKPPEKRFIIKGTRPENGLDGLPYTEYRFMIYDVEEVTSWEKNVRDGVYYLTVIRSDIRKFTNSTSNVSETITRRPLGLANPTTGSFITSYIEEVNNYDKDTRVASNINYLYPSINEEGPIFDVKKIWNPPQTDSRVLIEPIGQGKRVKDLSVPNAVYYRSSGTVGSTGSAAPFAEVPSLTSITAEAAHRLVQCLDLRYAGSTSASTDRVAVAPVLGWDVRKGANDYNTDVNVYGSGSYRIGANSSIISVTNANTYGIEGEANDRRIPVVAKGSTFTLSTLQAAAPTVPLYRPSILRASSHTWEYVGLGSGNYSTGFPNLQTRVLKPYEQFIAQGYENAGGFVASTGTNSNGDQYVGNQVIQAGGTSTVTLNVPKIRKSSESNYVDITNIENRISNSVVNVTAASGRSSSSQSALKALSNFFNTSKLSVTDRASIQNLIINDRLFISNTRINNGAKFPEANTEAFGFVKAARPEKTGFISTDTNDRLYVSPKFLDAWRIKRQLVSASNITLDNNRIYIQPLSRTLIDGQTTTSPTALSTTSSTFVIKESAGIPSFGSVDVEMNLKYVEDSDYYISGGVNIYFNPKINVTLNYSGIDYTTNIVSLSSNQNYIARQTYLENILGTTGFNTVIKNISSPIDEGASASEKDIKFLRSKLTQNVVVDSVGNPTPASPATIYINSTDWTSFPDRGAVTLREYPRNGTLKYSTYVYYKSAIAGELKLVRKVANASGNDSGHTYTLAYDNLYAGIDDKNVFFTGCTTTVTVSDRWAREEPFIPSVESISEDIDLESATLYSPPEKVVSYTGAVDTTYLTNSLPNPFSAKALGVNLQNRQAVKKFAPLAYLNQVQQWCETSGFGPNDNIELLMKPGYYKLDGSTFPCNITINGSGLAKSSVYAGKEQTGTSAGRVGGYLEDSVKRGDSIYFYRAPSYGDQWGFNSDRLYVDVSGGITSKGGLNLSNVQFLGLNEAITKNEILDELYSTDSRLVEARRNVRKAFYIKNFIKSNYNTVTTDGIAGTLTFTGNTTVTTGQATLSYYLNSINSINSAFATSSYGEINTADKTNARYMVITLNASSFTSTSGSPSPSQRFIWARKYIIPGTTLYWLPSGSGTINANTRSTKVISVRYTNPSSSTDVATWATSGEKIEIIVSLYQSASGNNGNLSYLTNATEDLDINSGLGAYIDGTNAKLVFSNDDNSEFTTLTFNWAINNRKSFLPKGFSYNGGYQPAIIKTTSATAAEAQKTIVLTEDITDLQVGDIVYGTNIATGSTVDTINTSTKTITISDNILTGGLSNGAKLSFTQLDNFGNTITKYDKPEIFGIIGGFDPGKINLVLDLNPSYEIDSSIRPYPSRSFVNYVAILLQLKDTLTGSPAAACLEDASVAIPYKYRGFRRITGFVSDRFVLLEVDPNAISTSSDPLNPSANSSPYIDNVGIDSSLLSAFSSYTPLTISGGGGKGTGFTANNIVATNITTTAGLKSLLDAAITNGGSAYNGFATVTLTTLSGSGSGASISVNRNAAGTITSFNVSGATINYNGTFSISVTDRKGYINVNGATVNLLSTTLDGDQFVAVSKENLLTGVNGSSPYLRTGTTNANAFGKNAYLSWPYAYRGLRRRFLSASLPNIGNFSSPIINVDAIPGSNVPLKLSGVTIGAQSPADESANRFGGGYRGGIIRSRGSRLSLIGTRFRGNLSLDWTGLLCNGPVRNAGSFTYGHSVELLQMEDQNELTSLGSTEAASYIGTSKDDEDFRRVTEFKPDINLYLEPSRDPYGNLCDGDGRTFPINTYQAIRRFNQSDSTFTAWDGTNIAAGALLTKLSLSERYIAPYAIYYDGSSTATPVEGSPLTTASGNASAVRLRWNNSTSAVSNGNSVGGNLDTKQLSFLYPANKDGNDVVTNIFLGAFATKIVKSTNIETSYATVTKVELPLQRYNVDGTTNSSGNYKMALIKYTGNIPVTAAAGSSVQIQTTYLTSRRFKYVSTATSRYSKVNVSGRSELNLATTGTTYAAHADIKISITGTLTANITRQNVYYLINSRAGSTPGQIRMSTNSSGQLTSLDILDFGSGHLETDTFSIQTAASGGSVVTTGITLTALRNLSDDIKIFKPGEYIGVLPQNCFVLNSINNPSISNIKKELQKAKMILRPGSYISYGGVNYKIAKDDTSNGTVTGQLGNKPYIGVYRYINEGNVSDIRANIVVMLEDQEYTPTWTANTRFDIYDADNVLDYWPTTGRITIGNLETCDFEKAGDPTSNTGYQLRITRSMTKYYPHYIRDWEGLDPNDSLSEVVTVESFVPTEIRLADPVDVTCYGFKRIQPSAVAMATSAVPTFVSPTGFIDNKVAKVSIPSTNVDADFEKVSIGQIVTIPYRDLQSYGSWEDATLTVTAPRGTAGSNVSSNRAGDLRVSATFTKTGTYAQYYVYYNYQFQIFGNTNTDSSIFNSINPSTGAKMYSSPGGYTGLAGNGFYTSPAGIRLYNYFWCQLNDNAIAGTSTTLTIKAGYDTTQIATAGQFTGFIDSSGLLNVTAVADGGLYRGQTIRTTSAGGPVIAYISGAFGDNPIDGVLLTGKGGIGTYRVTFSGVAQAYSSQTLYGTNTTGSLDYLVYAVNNCCWTRVFTKKAVDSNGITTLTLNAPIAGNISANDWALIYTYNYFDNNVTLVLDKALLSDLSTGTQFKISPALNVVNGNYGAYGPREENSYMFKSRIIDIKKETTSVDLYLADDYPENWSDTNIRHYGIMFLNHGGWTYPKTGGSSFRVNNVSPGTTNTTISLPNRSSRIQPGDNLSYQWEDELIVLGSGTGTITCATNSATVTGVATSFTTQLYPGYNLYNSSDVLIGTVSSITSDTSLSLTTVAQVAVAGAGFKYSSTGGIFTHASKITAVGAVDSNGYSQITLDNSVNHILYTTYGVKKHWLSIDDVFVSHRTGNFANDGPVADKFIFSDTGVKLTFGDYSIWNENYSNYISSPDGITGRQGWVGNFGISNSGKLVTGIQFNGASAVQWGRQYNTSIWLSAVPFHARWQSAAYSTYMAQIQSSASIESMFAPETSTVYDNTGRHSFQAINHSWLGYGSVYGGTNTGSYLSKSGETYDTKQYRWSRNSTTLVYSLQDASISSSGVVSGGTNSKIAEQLIINNVIHYKPTLDITSCTTTASTSITTTTSSNTITADLRGVVVPGDAIYSGSTPSAANYIGTVVSVTNTTTTLARNAAVATTSNTSWSIISPRIKKAGATNSASVSLVFSGGGITSGLTDVNAAGTAGYNVISNASAGYDRYNFRFNILRRNYNQTPLLNTYDQILPCDAITSAANVVRPRMGDLSKYVPAIFNLNVTRLNPKTHVESSISVVGSQCNI